MTEQEWLDILDSWPRNERERAVTLADRFATVQAAFMVKILDEIEQLRVRVEALEGQREVGDGTG